MGLVALSPGTVTLTLRDSETPQQLVLSVGVPGPAGATGATGAPGVGVPAGGLEGQVLVKSTDVSYDTAWVDNYALQVRAQVRNETGATLAKGTVVYINGGAGNKVTVTKAIATGDATSAQTLGVIIADIPNNQNGYACVLGLLSGLNTIGYTEGQQLYLSPTAAGAFTTTKPSAPYHMVYVAIVERVHANQGTILVRVQNGFEVAELHDAAISSVANNDLFVYESATSLWKNKSVSTLGLATQAWVDAQGYLQAGALTGYALQSWVTSQGYITSSALTGYLLASTAAATYYPLTNPAGYITSSALSGYATQSWVTSQGYITSSALSPYLTSATAASTYQPIGSYLTDAPSDGTPYVRKNGAWEQLIIT